MTGTATGTPGWPRAAGADRLHGAIAALRRAADLSGVSGTPTFFVNGKRHHGAYDISTLSDAVRSARTQVLISSPRQPRRAS